MNITVYLFGEFNLGYSQFPDDYTSSIFKNFYSNSKSDTQVAIHRDGNLMYYAYIRKLEYEKYIGLCIVINDLYLTQIKGLFSLFENVISNIITKGKIIHFNEKGEIIPNISKLYTNKEDVDSTTESLRASFNHLRIYLEKIPAVSYGISKDSVNDFTINDRVEDIIKSSYQNGYTYIYKSEGYNTEQLNSYKGVLQKISKENSDLKSERIKLESQIKEIKRQKKQFRNVIILVLIVLGCSFGLYFLSSNLNETQLELNNANDFIKEKIIEVQNYRDSIFSLNKSLKDLKISYKKEQIVRKNVEAKLSTINQNVPFLITGSRVDKTKFIFDYCSLKDTTLTVTLKAVNDQTSEVVSNTHQIYIQNGTGTIQLDFAYNLNVHYYYYIILMYEERIIAGKRW